jgi:hypothetical protein
VYVLILSPPRLPFRHSGTGVSSTRSPRNKRVLSKIARRAAAFKQAPRHRLASDLPVPQVSESCQTKSDGIRLPTTQLAAGKTRRDALVPSC